jgi:NAD+ diphosphatase
VVLLGVGQPADAGDRADASDGAPAPYASPDDAPSAGTVYVAAEVPPEAAEQVAARAAPGGAARWTELRPAALAAPAPDAALLAYARGMVWWHTRHRFCGVCGAPTAAADAGHMRLCPRCDARHFPRTDPAVIVLVAHAPPGGAPEDEACLLGSGPGWPEAMYSVLAGFVEPGESLEEAVRREVWEEAGVRVGAARYASSQPWPFPQSLMVGFTARADPATRRDRVRADPAELRDARWFTRAELDAAVAAGRVRLSPPLSIARRLIDEWRAAGPAAPPTA